MVSILPKVFFNVSSFSVTQGRKRGFRDSNWCYFWIFWMQACNSLSHRSLWIGDHIEVWRARFFEPTVIFIWYSSINVWTCSIQEFLFLHSLEACDQSQSSNFNIPVDYWLGLWWRTCVQVTRSWWAICKVAFIVAWHCTFKVLSPTLKWWRSQIKIDIDRILSKKFKPALSMSCICICLSSSCSLGGWPLMLTAHDLELCQKCSISKVEGIQTISKN